MNISVNQIASPSVGLSFTKANFPAGSFFSFDDDLYQVHAWNRASAKVFLVKQMQYREFKVDDTNSDYFQVRSVDISFSI